MRSKIVLGFSILIVSLLCGMIVQEKMKINLTKEMIAATENLIGLKFSDAKRDSMLEGLQDQLANYENIRKTDIPNSVWPAQTLNPIPVGFKIPANQKTKQLPDPRKIELPKNRDELAFFTIPELAYLLKNKKISSEALTHFFIDRLKKYDPKLKCVITITEERAIREAKFADEEIKAGKYRGLLHGIPYGAKDLLAAKGYKTTWGSAVYKDQMIDEDATVIKRLNEAGAVLIAKLTMGELAWGDVWFGGKTRNPWNTERGSSGSSAGSGSATSAGLVPFAIGTETWGSIVSPSTECGVTGLRPTSGRVSRTGAMALAWSMDKIGPIARSAEDCAIVFNAIYGPDGKDQTLIDVAFNYEPGIQINNLKIGYLKSDFDKDSSRMKFHNETLTTLEKMGVKLIPVSLPSKYPTNDLAIILTAEAGAAFDDLTRSGKDDQMVRQIKNAWPNVFRASRFIPAVEYIQANRIRYMLIQDMQTMMTDHGLDAYIAPSFEGDNLLLTNLTGHPCVVLPNGFNDKGLPTSICFMGKLFGEAEILAIAKQYQDQTSFHKKHPNLN